LKPEIAFQDMDIRYKNETKFLGLYWRCKMGCAHKTCE